MANDTQAKLDVPRLVQEAAERCRDHLTPTPLEYSMYLSREIGGEVWLKLDSMQRTSSFKFRGALNKILSLTEEELDQLLSTHQLSSKPQENGYVLIHGSQENVKALIRAMSQKLQSKTS